MLALAPQYQKPIFTTATRTIIKICSVRAATNNTTHNTIPNNKQFFSLMPYPPIQKNETKTKQLLYWDQTVKPLPSLISAYYPPPISTPKKYAKTNTIGTPRVTATSITKITLKKSHFLIIITTNLNCLTSIFIIQNLLNKVKFATFKTCTSYYILLVRTSFL